MKKTKFSKKQSFRLLPAGLSIFLALQPTITQAAAASVPASFTLEGMLYNSPTGTDPLLDASVHLRIQILNPTKDCVLYDEQQTINTASSQGIFHTDVGSQVGDPIRTPSVDAGNSMTTVFQNTSTIPGIKDNGQSCGYTPASADLRYLRIIVTPSQTGVADVLSPDMEIGSVPTALVAETLQGLSRAQVLELGAGQLTQGNVETIFSSTNYPALQALLSGTSSSYLKNSSSGVGIPALSSAPTSPPAGTVWYNSTTSTLQFSDGTATPRTIGTSGGSVTAVTASAPLVSSGGTAPAISLGTVGVANGGTGSTTLTGLIKGNGTSAFTAAVSGTDYLTASGATTNGHIATWNGTGQLIDGGALPITALTGDVTASGSGSVTSTVAKVNGTTVPVNAAADQALLTSASATGAWTSIPNCQDTVGSHLNYNTTTHAFSCGTSSSSLASQWNNGASSSINYVAGNVGIGTSAPTSALQVSSADTSTSGATHSVQITPTYNQASSTSSNTDLLINRTETSVGSGTQMLIDAQVGGTSKFYVTSGGVLYSSNTISSASAVACGNYNGGGNSNNSNLTINNKPLSTVGFGVAMTTGTMSHTTGSFAAVKLTPTYNQTSSTAANTDLLINRTETSVGSGSQYLIDAQVGGTSKFNVTNGGRGYFSGNVGIGTSSPATKLDVVGSLRVGNGGETCNAALAGGIIYTGGNLQYCNGSAWNTLTAGAASSYLSSSGGTVSGNSTFNGSLGISSSAYTYDLDFGGNVNRSIGMDRATIATAGSLNVSAAGAISGGSNGNGGNLVLASGLSTGSGSSSIQFQTSGGGASGTADSAPSTKMTILGNGNVGIGTTSPSYLLDINGNARVNSTQLFLTGATSHSDGSKSLVIGSTSYTPSAWGNGIAVQDSGSAAISMKGGTIEGDWSTWATDPGGASMMFNMRSNADTSFWTNGSERMRIKNSGNVGIGTSSPAALLHVNGTTALFGSSSTTAGAFVYNNAGAKGYFGIYDTGNSLLYGFSTSLPSPTGTSTIGGYYKGLGVGGSTSNTGNPIFGVLSSSQSLSGIGNTTFTIYDNNKVVTNHNVLDDGSGNVGIGTTSPLVNMEIAGNIKVGQAPTTLTTFSASATTSDTVLNVVSTTGYPNNGILVLYTSGGGSVEAVSYSGKTATTFTGVTRALFGTAAATRSTGDIVDICLMCVASNTTSAPKYAFTQGIGVGVGAFPYPWMNNNGLIVNGLLRAQGGNISVSSAQGLTVGTSSTSIIGSGSSNSTDYWNFKTNNTTRLYLDGSGKVGIGNAAPAYTLDVAGDINTSSCFRIGATTVSGTCTSDERLKENIRDYDQGLNELLGIRVRTYQFNGLGEMPKTGETAVGVIAQEVERTVPSLVKTREVKMHPEDREKTAIKVVDYSKFSYMLINAVKELYGKWFDDHRTLASIQAKTSQLEAESARIKAENAQMKAWACQKEPSAPFCR